MNVWIFLKKDYQQDISYITGLQMNLYAMDIRTYGIYRFGIIDKIFLPASTPPAYEPVHVMLRSLEVCYLLISLLIYISPCLSI